MKSLRHPSVAALVAALWFCAPLVSLRAIPLHVFLAGGGAAPSGGTITYIAAATSTFAATRSPTISYPTAVINDIWLAIIVADGSASYNGTPPTGWTKLDEVVDSIPDSTTCVFWRRVDGSEGGSLSWSTIMAVNETGSALVVAYRNCKLVGSPFNTQGTPSGGGAATPLSFPAVTTTVDNCMVVGIVGIDPASDLRTFTWSVGTEVIGKATTPSGVNSTTSAIYVGQLLKTPAGASTLSGSFDANENTNAFTYVLEPQ